MIQDFGLISSLNYHSWSDHNHSDPGIIFLDNLFYVITDLAYRIGFNLSEVLVEDNLGKNCQLLSIRDLLITVSHSYLDFRKLLLDIEDVKNVNFGPPTSIIPKPWYASFLRELIFEKTPNPLLPHELYKEITVNGIYWMQLFLHKDNKPGTSSLINQTLHTLQSSRPICSDFGNVQVVSQLPIRIEVDIELGETDNLQDLQASLIHVIEQYLTPRISFQSLEEYEKRRFIEEIYEGPVLSSGFIDTGELTRLQPRKDIRRSDLIRELMTLSPQVRAIRSLKILVAGMDPSEPQEWLIELHAPPYLDKENSQIRFFREDIEVSPTNTPISPADKKPLKEVVLDYPIPQGRDRNIGRYTSIRLHLPEVFGVGPKGISPRSTVIRRAQASQLSAYLLFFEQILANSFAQLANAWRLFDPSQEEYVTYFHNEIGSLSGRRGDPIPSLEGIFASKSPEERLEHLQEATESPREAINRIHRFLDHLLARYGESFQDYTELMRSLPHSNPATVEEESIERDKRIIRDKRLFLQEFPELSSQRGLGHDYTQEEYWDTQVVSGLKKRIARKLGILSDRINLSDGSEGFYLIEHILLRPIKEDEQQGDALLGNLPEPDPYSFRITYIFPIENGRFNHTSFRDFTQKLLRTETPAHIRIQIHWLPTEKLLEFEALYKAWLEQLHSRAMGDPQWNPLLYRITRDEMIDYLFCLERMSIYKDHPVMGMTFPNRNTLISSNNAQQEDNADTFSAEIVIHTPQVGVTYTLFDRDFLPKNVSARISDEELTTPANERTLTMKVAGLTQDAKFHMQATKTLTCNGNPHSLRPVFLKEPIKIQIGIITRKVEAKSAEIDYNTPATLIVFGIQAEVTYQLFFPGDPTPISDPISGNEGINLEIETNIGLREDSVILVKGYRGGEENIANAIDIGEAAVRVRANPGIKIIVKTPILDYARKTVVELLGDDGNGNFTQASVTYKLFLRDIADREFVHHKSPDRQPPEEEITTLSIPSEQVEVKVHRPGDNPTEVLLPTISEKGEMQPRNDGQSLEFDSGELREDTLFLVVAEKDNHEKPVVLGEFGRAHIGIALIRPNPNPIPNYDSTRKVQAPINTRGIINVESVQPGVKYYLRYTSNGRLQKPVYVHVESGNFDDPRKDGVGLSLVGVDTYVGPPAPQPIQVSTDNPITENKTMQLIAEKVHTGLSIQIGQDFDFQVF